MIKIGIIGATGYTGVELLRLLSAHPQASVEVVTSRQKVGSRVSETFPNLRGHIDPVFSAPEQSDLSVCDVVFSATPTGIAMQHAAGVLEAGGKFIDLSGDFRLKDIGVWEKWYGMAHQAQDLVSQAVYGLPEINRQHIKHATLIACPGCYPTASQLALLPLLINDLIDPGDIVIDAKSGISGAGRKESIGALFCEASDSINAYAVDGHRHLPEIIQGLKAASGKQIGLTFVPHLTPMIRGILATCYATLLDSSVDLQSLFADFYADEPFVDVLNSGQSPQTGSVRGSNICRISVFKPQQGNKVVVLAAEDNLVKGAAGQAIQNMNISCGLPETMGLEVVPLMP